MADTLVVVSKIKKTVKEAGLRTGGDYIEALSKRVAEIVSGLAGIPRNRLYKASL